MSVSIVLRMSSTDPLFASRRVREKRGEYPGARGEQVGSDRFAPTFTMNSVFKRAFRISHLWSSILWSGIPCVPSK